MYLTGCKSDPLKKMHFDRTKKTTHSLISEATLQKGQIMDMKNDRIWHADY